MEHASKRSTRLIEMAEHLAMLRQPVRIMDLAERFYLHRSTIHRMLCEIEAELLIPIEREPDGRVWIDPDKLRFNLSLTLNEAMAVFLSARLLARYSDKPNPHAVSRRTLSLCRFSGTGPIRLLCPDIATWNSWS
jgi:predicted DNA-binding transcriptional regulator YafY